MGRGAHVAGIVTVLPNLEISDPLEWLLGVTISTATVPTLIVDARTLPRPPTLRHNGFTLRRHPTLVDFDDDAQIRAEYYPQMEALVQAATGAAAPHTSPLRHGAGSW